jgi:hypothetical protein
LLKVEPKVDAVSKSDEAPTEEAITTQYQNFQAQN